MCAQNFDCKSKNRHQIDYKSDEICTRIFGYVLFVFHDFFFVNFKLFQTFEFCYEIPLIFVPNFFNFLLLLGS